MMGSPHTCGDTVDLAAVGALFELPGTFHSGARLGRGHIHDSYLVGWEHAGQRQYFVHQRLNTRVFPSPPRLMETALRVTVHLRSKLAHLPECERLRRVLTFVPARSGGFLARTEDGAFWRTTRFIAGGRTLERVEEPSQAFQAARAFGQFLHLLADLPPPPPDEVIPRFHDTPWRFQCLLDAARRDAYHRAAAARAEIEFALAREGTAGALADALQEGVVPERIVHNDTKVDNVLFDQATGEALCVLDLDTVMPGTALFDFGDLVRSAVASTAEDARDVSTLQVRLPIFAALLHGYLAGAGACLVPAELERLVVAAEVITLECGIRFLTDHLEGDRYFPAHRPNHNLDRARTQFALLRALEAQRSALERILDAARATAAPP